MVDLLGGRSHTMVKFIPQDPYFLENKNVYFCQIWQGLMCDQNKIPGLIEVFLPSTED